MSADRDYAREIADAMKAGDVSTLGALAIELVAKAREAEALRAAEEARREKDAARKRLERASRPRTSMDVHGCPVTSQDVQRQAGTGSPPLMVPLSPSPGTPNPSPPLNPPSPVPAVATSANGGVPK